MLDCFHRHCLDLEKSRIENNSLKLSLAIDMIVAICFNPDMTFAIPQVFEVVSTFMELMVKDWKVISFPLQFITLSTTKAKSNRRWKIGLKHPHFETMIERPSSARFIAPLHSVLLQLNEVSESFTMFTNVQSDLRESQLVVWWSVIGTVVRIIDWSVPNLFKRMKIHTERDTLE